MWPIPPVTFINVTNSTDPKAICDLFHASKITFVTSSMHFQNSVTNSTKTISIWIRLDLKTVEKAIIGSGNGHNFFVTISTANYGLFHKNFECDQFHTWSLVWPFPLFQLCLCPQLPLWPFPLNFLWLITFSRHLVIIRRKLTSKRITVDCGKAFLLFWNGGSMSKGLGNTIRFWV